MSDPNGDRRQFRHRRRWELALRYSGLPVATKGVAWALATWMNHDGQMCRPGMPALEEATSLKRRQVLEHVRLLRETGWLAKVGGGHRGRAAEYVPLIPLQADERLEEELGKGAAERTLSLGKGASERTLSRERVRSEAQRVRSAASGQARKGALSRTPAFKPSEPPASSPEGSPARHHPFDLAELDPRIAREVGAWLDLTGKRGLSDEDAFLVLARAHVRGITPLRIREHLKELIA